MAEPSARLCPNCKTALGEGSCELCRPSSSRPDPSENDGDEPSWRPPPGGRISDRGAPGHCTSIRERIPNHGAQYA